ncbi:circadian clock protein KaiC [Methylocaldum marinum]|uniref:non-specific serine/threonine protein kinase n=1 Tax=Methylocaldum marinum TaxID=1432792 RepID=A0A250KTK1_9GAMM|nr:circadian clock protein KaiC [Methylocaldum marinum]BBA34980.1 circadian clock protein KaiC [Methylocaldum marinum]
MTSYRTDPQPLEKSRSGIAGLDEITNGGLPKGRPTLICGSAGCGKTLFAMEFLVKGAVNYGEPGVFMAFEETAEELTKNVRSLGFHLDELAEQNKLIVDYVYIERSEIEETGEYDLDGLFIRLGHAIDSIGAKRVVLDTLETLFSGLSNQAILRAELRRLFRWLKDKGVTAIITAERGAGMLTRHGLEEYVSDCVILLDHRVNEQIATRRLRIVKYRGSSHGSNEYPFLIDEGGVDVLPITSIGLNHTASHERISSGLERLDAMLGGKGFYRGSSVLVSGTAGTGKSSLAATFVDAAGKRGEKAIYFAFEESPSQIVRNMRSIGIDLEPHLQKGLLQFRPARPTLQGLEAHLATMYKVVRDLKPHVVVVDPITNLMAVGTPEELKSMLMRLVDFLKANQITALFISLTHGATVIEQTDVGISSLIDTWLLLRDTELSGERNRVLYLLKSRGMAHSNQVREFLITDRGIDLVDVYTGPEGVLTGSARLAQEARERAATVLREQEIQRKERELERKRQAVEAQIAALRSGLAAEEEELQLALIQARHREAQLARDREAMARGRKADSDS